MGIGRYLPDDKDGWSVKLTDHLRLEQGVCSFISISYSRYCISRLFRAYIPNTVSPFSCVILFLADLYRAAAAQSL